MASSAIGATGALASLPAGSLVDFAGSAAPDGWLMCDGSAVSRTVYAQLFASVGTTYGSGDGSTTFNLPDFRGRFARYMDNMGTPAGAAGRDTGRALGTSQIQSTKAPNTNFTGSYNRPTNVSSGWAGWFVADAEPNRNHAMTLSTNGTVTIGGGDAETRPINLSCNRIIKY